MRNDIQRKLALASIVAMALASAACQSGGQNNSSANAATAGNGAAAAPAAEEDEFAASARAQNATGPVAMPADAQLPQPCQAYVNQVQSCIDKARASGLNSASDGQVEKVLRGTLHRERTVTWPVGAQAGSMERACTQSSAELGDDC